ncbi:MAG: DUF6807 family protein, partial [Isosphaeraceae bacterium]
MFQNRRSALRLLVLLLGIIPGSPARAQVATDASRSAPKAATDRPFRIAPVDGKSLGIWEGDRPVLVYNHGTTLKQGVPKDRARSGYVHPIYGLDGEVITDDFPRDHYHHRGLFWAWPHNTVNGREVDLWALQGVRNEFERWLRREAGPEGATLGVKNAW